MWFPRARLSHRGRRFNDPAAFSRAHTLSSARVHKIRLRHHCLSRLTGCAWNSSRATRLGKIDFLFVVDFIRTTRKRGSYHSHAEGFPNNPAYNLSNREPAQTVVMALEPELLSEVRGGSHMFAVKCRGAPRKRTTCD